MEQHSFGYWLGLKRKTLDFNRERLAERLGCSAAAIRKIEAEERRPSALTLFAERARAVRPGFTLAENIQVVSAICARLDGVPLAIELIGVRLRLMSSQVLLETSDG